MKVLLLTTPAPGRTQYGFYLGEKRFPLGLGYIASVLRKHNHTVVLRDLYAKHRKINFKAFDYIGIYTNTICFKNGSLPLIKHIHTAGFKGKIVVGGPHTSVMLHTIPPTVDHVVIGEGEYAMLDIVEGRKTERIITAERIEDLDSLPRVAYDMYDLSLYNLKFEELTQYTKVFTYSSSRGCPFACTFCSSKNIYHRKWTAHTPQRVINDIKFLIKKYGIDGIYFREDNFTVNRKRIREICELLLRNNIKIAWKCEARADMSYEDLALMKRAGCVILYVGFESGSPALLERFKKNIDIDQAIDFAQTCKTLGILVYGSFVTNTPWETAEDRKLTNAFIRKTGAKRICKNKYLAMPGSEMYEEILKNPELAQKYDTVIIK